MNTQQASNESTDLRTNKRKIQKKNTNTTTTNNNNNQQQSDSFRGEPTGRAGLGERGPRAAEAGDGVPEQHPEGDPQLPEGGPRYGQGLRRPRQLPHVRRGKDNAAMLPL